MEQVASMTKNLMAVSVMMWKKIQISTVTIPVNLLYLKLISPKTTRLSFKLVELAKNSL